MKHQLSTLGQTRLLTLQGELDALACDDLTPVLSRCPESTRTCWWT